MDERHFVRCCGCSRRTGAGGSSGPDAKRAMQGGDHVQCHCHIATRVTRAGLAVVGAVPPKIITDTGNPLWTAPRCLRYSLGRAVTLRVESGARARVEAHRRPPGRRCRQHLRRAPLAPCRSRAAPCRPRTSGDDHAADEALRATFAGRQRGAAGRSRQAVFGTPGRRPPFSNQRARCRVAVAALRSVSNLDRGCVLVQGADHFDRICWCGHSWAERCRENPGATPAE